jgi:hypothetical protein
VSGMYVNTMDISIYSNPFTLKRLHILYSSQLAICNALSGMHYANMLYANSLGNNVIKWPILLRTVTSNNIRNNSLSHS